VGQFGNHYQDVLNASTAGNSMAFFNEEGYRNISGISDFEVNQLLDLDKELMRMFEIQQRKKNKNDEMVRTKIKVLNDKPALRDFLFKKVSDE